jgi:Cu/Ag efflux pump CusA
MVGETVEGIARYPINMRYPQSYRDSPERLRQLPILTPRWPGNSAAMGMILPSHC